MEIVLIAVSVITGGCSTSAAPQGTVPVVMATSAAVENVTVESTEQPTLENAGFQMAESIATDSDMKGQLSESEGMEISLEPLTEAESETPEEPQEVQTHNNQNTQFYDGQFYVTINGKTFSFPFSAQELTGAGIYMQREGTIQPEECINSERADLKGAEDQINIYVNIQNPRDEIISLSEGTILGMDIVNLQGESEIPVTVNDTVTFGSRQTDFVKSFGNPNSISQLGEETAFVYETKDKQKLVLMTGYDGKVYRINIQ